MVKMDQSKINTVGKAAVGDFLTKLMMFKATANIEGAKAMFSKYDKIDDYWLGLRKIVVDGKKPRNLWCQSNTMIEGTSVKLVNYDNTTEGVISSFRDRFSEEDNKKVLKQYYAEK